MFVFSLLYAFVLRGMEDGAWAPGDWGDSECFFLCLLFFFRIYGFLFFTLGLGYRSNLPCSLLSLVLSCRCVCNFQVFFRETYAKLVVYAQLLSTRPGQTHSFPAIVADVLSLLFVPSLNFSVGCVVRVWFFLACATRVYLPRRCRRCFLPVHALRVAVARRVYAVILHSREKAVRLVLLNIYIHFF